MAHRARLAVTVLLAVAGAGAAAGEPVRRPPAEASGAILAGDEAFRLGDRAEAADRMLAAVRVGPHKPDLAERALAAAILAGRPEAVALAVDMPADPMAILVLANADARAGRWRQAQARFATLPAVDVMVNLRRLTMAWAQAGAGSIDQALDTLRPGLAEGPLSGFYTLHAAMICDLAGREEEAGRLYGLANTQSDSKGLLLGTLLASWAARHDRPEDARAVIHAIMAGSPGLSIAEPALQLDASRVQVADAAAGLAEAYLMLGDVTSQDAPDRTLLLLQLAIDMKPDLTSARILASQIAGNAGQFGAATAMLAAVPPSDPLIAAVQLLRARFAELDGRGAEAVALLTALTLANPAQAAAWVPLGQAQIRMKQFAEAAASLGRAIDRTPRPLPASSWVLFYERGSAHDRAHDWPAAEADFQQALALSPDQPLVLNYLGYAWAEQHRNLPQARQMLERAVALRPNEGSFVDSLGTVLLLLDDATAALPLLEHAADLMPEDSTVIGHLGDAYRAMGRPAEAQVAWRRALILQPEPEEAAALSAKLAAPAVSTHDGPVAPE